jgi:hypothetical protein
MATQSDPELQEQPDVVKSLPWSHGLRLFRIKRIKDGKNISGTGKVIEGVQFDNGQVVIHWKTRYPSLGIFNSMEDFVQVHAKPFFKENEFEWVDGFAPDQQLNSVLDSLASYVYHQNVGIKDKAKGNIISEIIAHKRHNQRKVDPIVFNKRSGARTKGNDLRLDDPESKVRT